MLFALAFAACGGDRLTLAESPHTLYIPVAAAQESPQGLKGLAVGDISHLEDLETLGVSWWYVWGWFTEMGATPMVRSMELPPSCEPYILVGNEPDAQEPAGHPVAPAEAVERVRAIEAQCPASALIVGNVTGDGYYWLADFLSVYRLAAGVDYSGAIGVHCYTWAKATYCIERLAAMRELYVGEMWLTEFNVLNNDAGEFETLLNYASATFDRYAVYTNRQVPGNPGLPYATLVDNTGALDARGLIYAAR